MKIVVDTNIIFSAILNSQSRIGQLILNGSKYFDFYTVSLLNEEIFNHQDKILKITGYSEVQFREIMQLLVNKIRFIDDILISDNDLQKALTLVTNIDEEDALFVALANHLHCNLWSGVISHILFIPQIKKIRVFFHPSYPLNQDNHDLK